MRTLLAVLLALALIRQTWAGEDPNEPKVDKQTEDVLRNAIKFYSALKNCQVQLTVTTKMGGNGVNIETKSTYDVAVQPPNKFAVIAKEGPFKKNQICDGKTLTIWDGMKDEYTEQPAPQSIAEAFATRKLRFDPLPLNEMLVLDSLLSEKGYDGLLKDVTAGKYLASEMIGDVKVHHIRLETPLMKRDIFIADGDRPVLLKVLPAMAGLAQMQMSIDLSVAFADWHTDAAIPLETFTFKPSPDTLKVESFFRKHSRFTDDYPIDKPFPQLGLKTAKGEPFDFATNKKDVALIYVDRLGADRAASLSALSEVANDYKDKNLACYAVAEELPESLSSLADRQKYRCEALDKDVKERQSPIVVLQDKKQRLANEFGFLTTWIVLGKDGALKAVRKEIPAADLKTTLKETLDLVLAGKPVPPAPLERNEPKKEAPRSERKKEEASAPPRGSRVMESLDRISPSWELKRVLVAQITSVTTSHPADLSIPLSFTVNVQGVIYGAQTDKGTSIDLKENFLWPYNLVPLEKGQRCILIFNENDLAAVVPVHNAEVGQAKMPADVKPLLLKEILDELKTEKTPLRQRLLILLAYPIMSQKDSSELEQYVDSRDEWLRRAAIVALIACTGDEKYVNLAEQDLKAYLQSHKMNQPLDNYHDRYGGGAGHNPYWTLFGDYYNFLGSGGLAAPDGSRRPPPALLLRTVAAELKDNEDLRCQYGVAPLRLYGTVQDIPLIYKDHDNADANVRAGCLLAISRLLNLHLNITYDDDFKKHEVELQDQVKKAIEKLNTKP